MVRLEGKTEERGGGAARCPGNVRGRVALPRLSGAPKTRSR